MASTEWFQTDRYRAKEGLGVWEHKGKAAIAGLGNSPTTRRWDGDLSTSLGAWAILAADRSLEDAGLTKAEIVGVVSCPQGMGDEWGLSLIHI